MNAQSINLEDVSVVRWGHPILTHVSLQVAAGSCCAILGPNGAGRSTLLARAMVARAGLLLLDEPTAGLDLGVRAASIGVLDRLLNRPRHPTVVIISHRLDELPCGVDQVVLLKRGSVCADGPTAEVLTSERLSHLFDCRVEAFRSNGRYVAGVSDGSCCWQREDWSS